jgi:anthranilate phosphoribosyltransferase
VLDGRQGAARDVVLLNAGAALFIAGRVTGIREGIDAAASAIDSGGARHTLQKMVGSSHAEVVA